MKQGNVSETKGHVGRQSGCFPKGGQERPPGPGDISVELREGSGSQPLGGSKEFRMWLSNEGNAVKKSTQSPGHMTSPSLSFPSL